MSEYFEKIELKFRGFTVFFTGKAGSKKECTRPAIAMATIGVLIALLAIFTVLCVVIFIKLMKVLPKAPVKKT